MDNWHGRSPSTVVSWPLISPYLILLLPNSGLSVFFLLFLLLFFIVSHFDRGHVDCNLAVFHFGWRI